MSDQISTGERFFRDMLDLIPTVLAIGAMVIGNYAGESSGRFKGEAVIRAEAILHHAAHYEPDAKGNPVFTWNTPITQPPTP